MIEQGDERTLAKFAHLREQQRQIKAEERARAEFADINGQSSKRA
ncbi:hypothetical protein AB4Z42_17175 [Mycobacterium sp. 2YAF39]